MVPHKKPEIWGFIGLGSQGAPMARRMISAGLPTILWARRPEILEPFKQAGASTASTLSEIALKADYIGICVVNDDDVRQVCDILIPEMRPGAYIAIHATIHPETAKAVAAKAAERGIRVIDAPVSGGAPAAEAGSLTVMVGGDIADLEAVRPALETFGKLIIHLGPVGAGQQAKLINNTLFTANLGMAHDALLAAESFDISRAAMVQLIRASSGRSYGFDVRANMPPPAKFRHATELLAKDVRLLGETMGTRAPGFAPLREAANQFLEYVLEPTVPAQ
jgi:3-hydroxyisobutyrate dehydrogenase-like beta-hydroxyacid dehydrogenase